MRSFNSPPLDTGALREAVAGGGVDPRQWLTYGQVMEDEGTEKSVVFNDPDMPGPYVMVKLLMSGYEVPCRVASFVAGAGEGDWFPFVAGDEVVVGVIDGDERTGCVILGRLNNGPDSFPTLVSGNDPSSNTFAFRRLRVPFIFETASDYLVRSAATGAFFGIKDGAITFANADKALLQLGADVLGFRGGGKADVRMEIEPGDDKRLATMAVGQSLLQLTDQADSILLVTNALTISTQGNRPAGHGVTVEQVWQAIQEYMLVVGAVLVASPTPPTAAIGAALVAAANDPATGPAALAAAAASSMSPEFKAELLLLLATPPTGTAVGAGLGGLRLG